MPLTALHPFKIRSTYPCPMYASPVPAGFPSPADDYAEGNLDLNEQLIKHPAATFFVRASGDSMTGAGIQSGDLLVVDRATEPCDGSVVIAVLNGELTVKRLRRRGGEVSLESDNPAYKPILIGDGMELVIWGVVAHVIHEIRRCQTS